MQVPASGTIRFAGPFRNYDGIVIIDHGDGWMSLILKVSTQLEAGARVVEEEEVHADHVLHADEVAHLLAVPMRI